MAPPGFPELKLVREKRERRERERGRREREREERGRREGMAEKEKGMKREGDIMLKYSFAKFDYELLSKAAVDIYGNPV